MAPQCDLDKCSLKDDIDEIKKNQMAMTKANADNAVVQGKFVQKMDDFLAQYEKNEEDNKDERDILFTRTRVIPQGDVKYKHLGTAIFILSAIVGIVWKLATAGG